MRTQNWSRFLLSLIIGWLSFFPLSITYAADSINQAPANIIQCRKCSESKCRKDPTIGQFCYYRCAKHGGSGPECQKAANNAAGSSQTAAGTGVSDTRFIDTLRQSAIAAIRAEKGSKLQFQPNDSPEDKKKKIISKITTEIMQIDNKYRGLFGKKKTLEIKALWDTCEKRPAKNCGAYRDEALVRLLFCPPSTQKDCKKSFVNSPFRAATIQIGLPDETTSEDDTDDTSGN